MVNWTPAEQAALKPSPKEAEGSVLFTATLIRDLDSLPDVDDDGRLYRLDGIRHEPKVPALREFSSDRPCGVVFRFMPYRTALDVEGYFLSNRDGRILAALAGEAMPIKLIPYLEPEEITETDDGETVVTKSHLRAVHLCLVYGDASGSINSHLEAKGAFPMSKVKGHKFVDLVERIRVNECISKAEAMRRAVKLHPAEHRAYIEAANAGKGGAA